jgi:hypothetical protein
MEAVDAAMSPARIIEIVRTWPGLTEMGLSVERCKVKKLRPSTDGDLDLQYRLELLNGRTAEPFKVTILGRVYANGKGEREYAELRESWKGKEHLFGEANLNGLALYVPELKLLLYASLSDEKLPSLEVALSPAAMTPFLAVCLDPHLPGTERLGRCEVEILHHKPGERCTLRYRLETRDRVDCRTYQRRCIGKIYGDAEEGERVFATMVELARRGFGRDAEDGIRIPQPYGYLRELQMVMMEDVVGAPLSQYLAAPQLSEHLRTAARALVKIHTCSWRMAKKEQAEDQIASLERGVARAIQMDPNLTPGLSAALSMITAAASEVHCPDPVLVHGGFYLREILLGDGSTAGVGRPTRPPAVTIVDLDKMCYADPARDLGKFLAHLKWEALQLDWSEAEARAHAETFLAAYRPDASTELIRRIDFYYRAILLRRACTTSLRPKKRRLTAAVLEAAVRGFPLLAKDKD